MIVFAGRVLATLAGVVIVGYSFFGAVWVLYAASFVVERPGLDDAFLILTLASTDALVFALGAALLGFAAERRWPRWSSLRWLPVLAVAVVAVLMAASLATPT